MTIAFGSLKPWLLLAGIVFAGAGAITAVNQGVVMSRADGHPLDWLGDGVKCQKCDGSLKWTSGYRYECRNCKRKCTAKLIGNIPDFQYDEDQSR